MATLSPTGERYDLGRVLSRTFSQIVANWMVLGGFALIGAVVAAIFNAYGVREMLHIMTNPDPANPLALFQSPGYWIMLIGGLVVGALMQSGLTHGLLVGSRGESVAFGDCVSGAVRYFLPGIGLTILFYLGVGIGLMFILVPGLILMTMWSVSLSALVGEDCGVTGAFGRSRALTKGLRWPVFGTLLVFFLVFGFLLFAVQGFSSTGMARLYQSNMALALVATTISGTISTLLLTSFLVALYREVVLVKEGEPRGGLAEVFS